jgi:predicted secreted Zn-dependent protease
MPRRVRAALLALSMCGCASGAHATGLRVSIDEAFSPVLGVTAPQLNLELARRGPIQDGARWQGLTEFEMSYSFTSASGRNGCRVVDPRVTVRVVTTLPKWADRSLAAEGLRDDWDLYLGRLREHEEGHQRIAVSAGQELLEAVAELRAPDCDALRRSAHALVAERREIVAREQEGWDVETAHGLDGDH